MDTHVCRRRPTDARRRGTRACANVSYVVRQGVSSVPVAADGVARRASSVVLQTPHSSSRPQLYRSSSRSHEGRHPPRRSRRRGAFPGGLGLAGPSAAARAPRNARRGLRASPRRAGLPGCLPRTRCPHRRGLCLASNPDRRMGNHPRRQDERCWAASEALRVRCGWPGQSVTRGNARRALGASERVCVPHILPRRARLDPDVRTPPALPLQNARKLMQGPKTQQAITTIGELNQGAAHVAAALRVSRADSCAAIALLCSRASLAAQSTVPSRTRTTRGLRHPRFRYVIARARSHAQQRTGGSAWRASDALAVALLATHWRSHCSARRPCCANHSL